MVKNKPVTTAAARGKRGAIPKLMKFGDIHGSAAADAHGREYTVKVRTVRSGKLPDACAFSTDGDDYNARRTAGLKR